MLQMEDLFFGQKETGAKRVAMATALRASFCFLCDGQLWCQVSRTLLTDGFLAERNISDGEIFFPNIKLTGFPLQRTWALHNIASYSYFSLHAKIPDELSYSQLFITYQLTITINENYI